MLVLVSTTITALRSTAQKRCIDWSTTKKPPPPSKPYHSGSPYRERTPFNLANRLRRRQSGEGPRGKHTRHVVENFRATRVTHSSVFALFAQPLI